MLSHVDITHSLNYIQDLAMLPLWSRITLVEIDDVVTASHLSHVVCRSFNVKQGRGDTRSDRAGVSQPRITKIHNSEKDC